MTADLQVARDISGEIEAAEVEHAAQRFYDRVGGKPIAQIAGYSAYSWPEGQSLGISFDWHENTNIRKARYGAEFERKSAGEQWVLSEIYFDGEQFISSQDQPIHFIGYLERATLEQVTACAAGLWARCTTHPFAIGGVITNRLPPISCGNDHSESRHAVFVYQVSIQDRSPRPHPVRQPEPNALTIASISSSDNTYSLRIVDTGNGSLKTTQADCVGENCDPELLASLRAKLDQPIDSAELEKRLQDATAVLPAKFRGARIRSTQTLMLGTTEEFIVQFVESPVSESRKESVSVTCYRRTGTRDDWNCRYSVDSIRQRVPGQTCEVHLFEPAFSESELKQIVTELRIQLEAHPDIAATSGGIEVFSSSNDGSFACSFLHGNALWKAVFTYGDEVRLEALELAQSLSEVPRGTG